MKVLGLCSLYQRKKCEVRGFVKTATQTVRHLRDGSLYLDLNSHLYTYILLYYFMSVLYAYSLL